MSVCERCLGPMWRIKDFPLCQRCKASDYQTRTRWAKMLGRRVRVDGVTPVQVQNGFNLFARWQLRVDGENLTVSTTIGRLRKIQRLNLLAR